MLGHLDLIAIVEIPLPISTQNLDQESLDAPKVVASLNQLVDGVPITKGGPSILAVCTEVRADWKWQKDRTVFWRGTVGLS